MKFKVDENLPVEAAQLLRAAGHDALTVMDQTLAGSPDERIIEVCKRERRALVTSDLDLADVRTYPPGEYPGLTVLRLALQDKRSVLRSISQIVPCFASEPLEGHLWIVEESRPCIRGEAK